MFAIIESGGKQYRVQQGDVLRLEKLDAEAGATVDFPVLLLGGDDRQDRQPARRRRQRQGGGRRPRARQKIHIYKFKAKTNYRRHTGHRQPYTEVRVTEIAG